MLQNALSDVVNWRTTKIQVSAWMTIKSSRKSSNQLENCPKFLLCPKFAHKQQVCKIKRTQACDTRLARLISHTHHTNEFRQHCHVGNTAQYCRLVLQIGFIPRPRLLLATLKTRNQLQEESCVFSVVEHLFQSVGCMLALMSSCNGRGGSPEHARFWSLVRWR